MFQKMKVSTRLAVAFGLVLVLLLGVIAVAVNRMHNIDGEMRQITDVPLIAYPNAGLPVTTGGRTTYELGPEEMAKDYPALLDAGCNIVGACCGSNPEHIRLIADVVRSRRAR